MSLNRDVHFDAGICADMTATRWPLLRQIMRLGEVSLRELARQIGRDVRRVYDDVVALPERGLIERTVSGACCVLLTVNIHVDLHFR